MLKNFAVLKEMQSEQDLTMLERNRTVSFGTSHRAEKDRLPAASFPARCGNEHPLRSGYVHRRGKGRTTLDPGHAASLNARKRLSRWVHGLACLGKNMCRHPLLGGPIHS